MFISLKLARNDDDDDDDDDDDNDDDVDTVNNDEYLTADDR